ncbi:MAG: radical SAM/SPASM domain-containing protein [Alphaproteobacteria bacterium]
MFLGKEAFQAIGDPALAKAVFKKSVGRVEIETHSYCNRRCSYCPNVVGDRLGPNLRMDERLYSLIMENLREIDYGNFFVLSGYNEPLYDRAILDRIAQARTAMPTARIMTYTNGDYLSPGYIEELADAGLSYMHISIHLKKGDEFSDIYMLNRLSEISQRIGIAAKFLQVRPNEYIIAEFPHDKIEIETRAINFWKHGNNRGKLIEEMAAPAVRTSPCFFPFSHFYVGFSGNIIPCCHIRSDRPEHEPYLIGNMKDFDTIYQAYTSEAAVGWRRELVHTKPKKTPCDTCTAPTINDPNARKKFEQAYESFVLEKDPAQLPG